MDQHPETSYRDREWQRRPQALGDTGEGSKRAKSTTGRTDNEHRTEPNTSENCQKNRKKKVSNTTWEALVSKFQKTATERHPGGQGKHQTAWTTDKHHTLVFFRILESPRDESSPEQVRDEHNAIVSIDIELFPTTDARFDDSEASVEGPKSQTDDRFSSSLGGLGSVNTSNLHRC